LSHRVDGDDDDSAGLEEVGCHHGEVLWFDCTPPVASSLRYRSELHVELGWVCWEWETCKRDMCIGGTWVPIADRARKKSIANPIFCGRRSRPKYRFEPPSETL